MDEAKREWYSNQEIFEMQLDIQKESQLLKDSIKDLRVQLDETTKVIKKYNGLREDIDLCKTQVKALCDEKEAKIKNASAMREKIAWLLALALSLFAL